LGRSVWVRYSVNNTMIDEEGLELEGGKFASSIRL
jgi:hypothetical protein